ncbi:hypothetical protein PMAYCL1PPCAC_05720, partial [Pristionchus mayeri]
PCFFFVDVERAHCEEGSFCFASPFPHCYPGRLIPLTDFLRIPVESAHRAHPQHQSEDHRENHDDPPHGRAVELENGRGNERDGDHREVDD